MTTSTLARPLTSPRRDPKPFAHGLVCKECGEVPGIFGRETPEGPVCLGCDLAGTSSARIPSYARTITFPPAHCEAGTWDRGTGRDAGFWILRGGREAQLGSPIMCDAVADAYYEAGAAEVEELPAVSGGSQLADVETGLHADAYDPISDSFHSEPWESFNPPADPILTPEEEGERAAHAGLRRSDAPKGEGREDWLRGHDSFTGYKAPRGPSAEDVAFEMGRCAVLDSSRPIEAPAKLKPSERDAFVAGMAQGAAERHARDMAEVEESRLQAEAAEMMEVACG